VRVDKIDIIAVKNKIPAEELFRLSRFKEKVCRTKPHKHDGYYELIFLQKGQGVHWIDAEKMKVEPPMIFILRPGQVHCWELTAIPAGYVLMVKEAYLDVPERAPLRKLFEEAVGFSQFSLKDKEEVISQIFVYLEEEIKNQQHYSKSIVEAYIQLILSKILQTVVTTGVIEKSQTYQLYTAFNSLLHAAVPGNTKVNQFASLLSITPQNLNHICRKMAGKSASELIREEVLLEAKRYLIHTDRTIAQISNILQFTDASHFVKFFKKCAGTTPFKFRESYFQ
jgi:AraC family transcriptional activator of pobA